MDLRTHHVVLPHELYLPEDQLTLRGLESIGESVLILYNNIHNFQTNLDRHTSNIYRLFHLQGQDILTSEDL